MDPISIALLGGSLLSGIFGNRGRNQQQNSTTNSSQSGTTVGSSVTNNYNSGLSRPVYDPLQGSLRDKLLEMYINRIFENPDDLVRSQIDSVRQTANQGQNLLRKNIAESFASRGLSNSPAAALALANADNDRFSNIAQAITQAPMMREQILSSRLGEGAQFLSSLPVATASESVSSQDTNSRQDSTSQGTSQTVGNTQIPGNMLGGGISSLISALAGLHGAGAFSNNSAPAVTNPTPFMNPNFLRNVSLGPGPVQTMPRFQFGVR